MLKNYFKIAIRNLFKNKLYSAISITGLALGIAGSVMVLLFMLDELSFERGHEKADRICAVFNWWDFGTFSQTGMAQAPAVGPTIKEDFPEVEETVRFWKWHRPLILHQDKRFYEDRFVFADPALFEVFTFPFVAGDPKTALTEPYAVVLSASTARKYFGGENPVGRRISFWDNASAAVIANRAFNGSAFDLTITGVVQDPPSNTELQFDFLASFATFGDAYEKEMWATGPTTYLLLAKGASRAQLEEKFPAFLDKYLGSSLKEAGQKARLFLVPLAKVRQYFFGGYTFVVALAGIGLIVLLIGCINFMNLATARSAQRAKEVGVRKVIGARRSELVKQFLGESIIMAFAALPVALFLVEIALPEFNLLAGKKLALNIFGNLPLAFGLFGIVLLAGLVAGSYPALYLSRFQSVRVLKGGEMAGRKSGIYRFLIVAQFTVAIVTFIAVVTLNEQLAYAKNKDLGFNKEQIVVIPNWNRESIQKHYAAFRDRALQTAGVLNMSVTDHYPGYGASSSTQAVPGKTDQIRMAGQDGDHEFIRTFGIALAAGRDFSRRHKTDAEEAIIINEAAVKSFGWASPEEAVGQRLQDGRTIIGVVKNYHIFSLHRGIGPAMIRLVDLENLPEWWSKYFVAVKIHPANVQETLRSLELLWQSFFPDRPFASVFLDEQFARFYQAEEIAGKVASLFSMIAISIACLGLFGLAAYSAERRTKEIGVRKVLGATVSGIVMLLSKEFVKLILFANLIAWPVAYFALSQFLQIYAYRINIDLLTFPLVGLAALAIALLTISSQAIKAALANPVEALRYE
jgi:putative ABC transport system permease protein